MSDSIFDLKALCERVAGRVDIIDELLQMLRATFPVDREALIGRLQAGDSEGAREIAHRLKGQFQTLGLRRAAEQALRIEQLAREGMLNLAITAVDDLDREFLRFESLRDSRSAGAEPGCSWPDLSSIRP